MYTKYRLARLIEMTFMYHYANCILWSLDGPHMHVFFYQANFPVINSPGGMVK